MAEAGKPVLHSCHRERTGAGAAGASSQSPRAGNRVAGHYAVQYERIRG